MRALTLITIAALVALPLTGCIENMDDLKDRLQRSAATETPDPTGGNVSVPGTNVTGNASLPEWKPPVARISVFDESGALAFESGFEAANVTDTILVAGGAVSLMAGDSEVLEANATVEKFAWTVNADAYEGRQVTVDMTEPGLYMVTLTVTDSKGSTDSQMVHLGVAPQPFTIVEEFEGGASAGVEAAAEGSGEYSSVEFTVLAEHEGNEVTVTGLKVTGTAANPTVDAILVLTSPSGTETVVDSAFVQQADGAESITLATAEAGTWTAELRMFAGATPSWTATVEVTYLQVVPGLEGDGHGGHAH